MHQIQGLAYNVMLLWMLDMQCPNKRSKLILDLWKEIQWGKTGRVWFLNSESRLEMKWSGFRMSFKNRPQKRPTIQKPDAKHLIFEWIQILNVRFLDRDCIAYSVKTLIRKLFSLRLCTTKVITPPPYLHDVIYKCSLISNFGYPTLLDVHWVRSIF